MLSAVQDAEESGESPDATGFQIEVSDVLPPPSPTPPAWPSIV